MVNRNTLKAIVVATTCLTPFYAFAQSMGSAVGEAPYNYTNGNEIEFGVMGVVGKNPDQAGRYNGLTTNGINAIGQFDFSGSSPWDSGRTWYYNFTGENLVFQTGTGLGSGISGDGSYISNTSNNLVNSGALNFAFGKQGTWEAGVYYDAISYTGNVIDSLYTLHGNQATLNPGVHLWGGGVGGTTAYTISQLQGTNAMQPVQVGTRRDILGGNFKYLYGDWTFSGALRHEHKEGSMEESFDGPYAGTAFALPIDYTTDRYDLAAAYNTRLNQTLLQYTFSNFHDANTFINLPYPLYYTTGVGLRSAAYSTPPSNSAHYLTLEEAINALPNTRINLNLRAGLEIQGDNFPPQTADPAPPTNYNNGASTLNAMAKVFQGKLSADSHPIANTDARVFYGFDGRQVSLNQYQVFGPGTSPTDNTFATANYVVPQNWLKQNTGAEVGYRIIPQYDTKLTLGYRFDMVNRSNARSARAPLTPERSPCRPGWDPRSMAASPTSMANAAAFSTI